jgi:hypothetical protein
LRCEERKIEGEREGVKIERERKVDIIPKIKRKRGRESKRERKRHR